MTDVAVLIADMVRAGVDPELIGRCAEALSHREAVLVPDEAAERRRAADRDRKARLRKSAEVVGSDGQTAPKESPHTPKETPPSTQKETPLRGSKKGSRLPDDFAPDIDWAVAQGLSRQQAESEAAKFRDFWLAKAGAGGVKLDWAATWRNWVRSALERPQGRAGPPSRPMNPTLAAALRLKDQFDAVTPSEIEGHHSPPRLVAISGRTG